MSTGPWQRWFAWHPVRTVERRQLTGPTFSPLDSPYLWEYRPTPDDRHETEEA